MEDGPRPTERLRFGVFQLDPTTGELCAPGVRCGSRSSHSRS